MCVGQKLAPAVGLRKYFEIDLINTAALKLMLTPAVGLRLILIYKFSGCKRNEMWGKSLSSALSLSLSFKNMKYDKIQRV